MKLVIPDKENPENPPEIITDPPKIRSHMTKHYQKIFNKQNLDRNPECLKDFLLEGDDSAPYEEFLIRRISVVRRILVVRWISVVRWFSIIVRWVLARRLPTVRIPSTTNAR